MIIWIGIMPSSSKNGHARKGKSNDLNPSAFSPRISSERTFSFLFLKKSFNWIPFGLVFLSLFLIQKGLIAWGQTLLILGVIAQFGQMIWAGQRTKASQGNHPTFQLGRWELSIRPPGEWSPSTWLILLGLAWVAFFVDLMSFPCHRWMCPSVQALPFRYSYRGLLVCWIFMVVSIWKMPQTVSPKDLSPRVSRWVMGAILALGLFMVSYRPLWPPGVACGDSVVTAVVARYINQLGFWNFFFNSGIGNSWQPFCSMLDSLIWVVAPGLSALADLKLADVLIEMAFILFVYFVGTEALNRRAGLFAAALCAVSHPLITKSVAGLHANAHAMAVVLALWLFFRAMNRPKMSHFLLWGAGVGLTVYTYIVNRPFVFIAVVGALVWILIRQKEERKMDPPALCLVGGTFTAFFAYMAYTNKYFASDNFFSRALDSAGYLLPCIVLAVLWVVGVYLWPKVYYSGKYPYLSGWIAGTWLAIILSFAKMADPTELSQIAYSGAPQGAYFRPLFAWKILFDGGAEDYFICHVDGDSFLGQLEITLGAVGLAFAVARPTVLRLFLVGVSVFFFTILGHTEHIQPCIGPFLLLAGLALEQAWSWLCALTRSRLARVLFVGFFAGMVLWTAQAEFDQIYVQWVDRFVNVDVGVWRRAVLDEDHDYHVYMGPGLDFWYLACLLNENRPIEVLQTNNLITLDTNEKLRDLAVYLRKREFSDVDGQLETRIRNLFPDAKWEELRSPWDAKWGETPYAVRCVIPAADLLKPQDLFAIQTVPSPCWTRSYFGVENALRPGILHWKTRIAQADVPPPAGLLAKDPGEMIRYEGVITASQSKDYELVCTASAFTFVELDGKRVINMKFPHTNQFHYAGKGITEFKSIHLAEGPHTLQVTYNNRNGGTLPNICWRNEGEKTPGTSIWSSFNW
jgi:hypothetical protein